MALFFSASPKASAEVRKGELVTFNFVDVDISSITKFISEITGKNFIYDERVKGKITIVAPTKLSIEDSFNLFTSVLELKGFTVMPSGVNAYKIIPASEARQKGIGFAKDREAGPVNESYIARLITLKNISSDDAQRLIQPMTSRDGFVTAFGPGNMLLVIDSGLNIEKILSIIDAIDQPSTSDSPEIFYLRHSSADAVVKILNEGIAGRQRARPAHPQGDIDAAKASADMRLNAVILFGDKAARAAMRSLITLLDVPSPEAQGRINVYFLENADAIELAKVMEGIIRAAAPARQAATQAGAAPATPFEAAGGITITPDKSTNSLVIVASPADYTNLVGVIRQLDRRRKQVFVEAMIVEASIDKLREMGAKWRMIAQSRGGDPVAIGGFGTMDTSSLFNVVQGLAGVTVGGMGNFLNVPITSVSPTTGAVTTSTLNVPGFAALFSLSEFRDVVDILSTPQILTSDNKEAEIVVGENVPFISKRERESSAVGTVLSSIERKDVGITLRLTPQIAEGDYVKLDVYQEISSVKEPPAAIAEAILTNVGPTTTKRSTKTAVTVKDNQTVVIGGLMQEKGSESVTKVPLLGDIPILGWLFRHKSTSKQKTNLLVFITPHVVKDDGTLARLTKEKETEFAKSEKSYAKEELLVRFREGVSDDAARKIIASKDAVIMEYLEELKIYHIRLEKDVDAEEAAKDFSSIPEVEYAEPNYKLRK